MFTYILFIYFFFLQWTFINQSFDKQGSLLCLCFILLFIIFVEHVPDDLSISADSAHPSVNHPCSIFQCYK